jgi:hypothetical protein
MSAVKIWKKNLTEVPNGFLPLTSGATYDTNESSGTKFKNA